jgi:hypothetical protein
MHEDFLVSSFLFDFFQHNKHIVKNSCKYKGCGSKQAAYYTRFEFYQNFSIVNERLSLLKSCTVTQGENQFIISKNFTSYQVTVQGYEVEVKPLQSPTYNNVNNTISDSLQTIGHTRLMLHQPADPVHYLKDFYRNKGWFIDEEE